MKQYLDLLRELVESGNEKSDRTGTGTLSKFGHQLRFDLQEGFPLLTTKKMFFRGVVEELLWFLSGSTDVKELQAIGVHFWDSWCDENGEIGHGYGKQLRNIDSYVPVIPKIFTAQKSPIKIKKENYPSVIKHISDSGTTAFKVGEERVSKVSGKYVILEELPADEDVQRIYWRVQFKETGYIATVRYGDILRGTIKDNYARSVFGVGFYGDVDKLAPHYDMLVNVWREMLRRCYYQNCTSYKSYGSKGVHVSEDWHNFSLFYADAKKIPGWSLKLEYPDEYTLDKDVLWASNRYGKDTCMWASFIEQSCNTQSGTYFTAKAPTGEVKAFPSLGEAQRKLGLQASAVWRCLNGLLKTHHGWSGFKYMPVPEGHVLRYRKIDQLRNAIAEIKHNPDSRRLVISLWNPQDMDRTTLPCCHGTVIQFYVFDGKLSCSMYQRSGDSLLGIPVNIASYALLTHMIAQQCDLEVGDLVWQGGDVHLYKNHIEQAKLQLQREIFRYPLPTLIINRKPASIDDYQFEDFTLVNYLHHPAIAAKVSV